MLRGDEGSWFSSGHICVIRHGGFGAPCGYVGVTRSHPLYELGYLQVEQMHPEIDVHGGLTYSGRIEGYDDIWFLGFDMAHSFDLMGSATRCTLRSKRTDQECIEEVNRLAAQIAIIGRESDKQSRYDLLEQVVRSGEELLVDNEEGTTR